jgi:hypothetical protein
MGPAALVLGSGVAQSGQPGPFARLYVEPAILAPGQPGTSQIILLTGPQQGASEVRATLTFDAAIASVDAWSLSESWATREDSVVSSGRVALSLKSDAGCAAATSCRLGVISWSPTANGGNAVVSVSDLQLAGAAVSQPNETPVPGVGAQEEPQPNGSLGRSSALLMVVLLGLAGTAMGAPLLLFLFGRRRRGDAPGLAAETLGVDLSERLAEAATAYLDAFELAADADQEPDGFFETLARQGGPPGDLPERSE